MESTGDKPDWSPLDTQRENLDKARRLQVSFKSLERWGVAIDAATAQAPRLVQRLDRPDDYYFIVDFTTGPKITARLALDARSGELLRASGVGRKDAELRPFVDATRFIDGLVGRTLDSGTAPERVVRRGTVGVHPVLVWKWSAASRSVLLPFFLLTVGDAPYYLRVDGVLHPELAKGRPGT